MRYAVCGIVSAQRHCFLAAAPGDVALGDVPSRATRKAVVESNMRPSEQLARRLAMRGSAEVAPGSTVMDWGAEAAGASYAVAGAAPSARGAVGDEPFE